MGCISFRISVVIAAIATTTFANPSYADDGLSLSPSSEWRFREYDDRCRISRNFGEGEDRTALWIEQGGAEPNYNLTLIGRPLRHPHGSGVHIQFGEEPEMVRSYIPSESSRGRPVLLMYGVNISQPQMDRDEEVGEPEIVFDGNRADAITSLRLRTSIVEPLLFELGSMAEPMAFLDQCGVRLSGVLSEAGRALTGEASPPLAIDPEDWLRPADYPRYLVVAGMEGQVFVRLTVNTSGRASSCFITDSNRPQLFDDAVCLGMMKRARFDPARNASGDPVASYYSTKVTLRLN